MIYNMDSSIPPYLQPHFCYNPYESRNTTSSPFVSEYSRLGYKNGYNLSNKTYSNDIYRAQTYPITSYKDTYGYYVKPDIEQLQEQEQPQIVQPQIVQPQTVQPGIIPLLSSAFNNILEYKNTPNTINISIIILVVLFFITMINIIVFVLSVKNNIGV
jgi:hypothetical protein